MSPMGESLQVGGVVVAGTLPDAAWWVLGVINFHVSRSILS